ncbi:hypothetical protein [Sinorhizobium terangae]|uniref:hypothetical protein n=1 Tax=Sinorhizobium terangae TaxID=110322 RepID=UPI0024B186A0|nr:hypothetical protein [Sinorhizobium terangae]WFU49108.1 hypothetical protein QA637_06820 [Sinorhizobium terangae]
MIAERFIVLSDFLEQASHFSELHSVKEVRRRKHVVEILELLAISGEPVDRITIGKKTKLGDANLSRVISNLAASGWVSRQQNGREVSIDITEGGLRSLEEMTGRTYRKSARDVSANPLAAAVLGHRWPEKLCSVAISDDEKGLTWWHDDFACLFPATPTFENAKSDIEVLRQHLAAATDATDEVLPEEVSLPDGRTFRVMEHSNGDGSSIWLSMDVTEYRQRLDLYARRERRLVAELDALKKWQAAARMPVTYGGDHQTSLEMFAALRRDLLTPVNAIYHSAYWLCKGDATNLTREQLEVVKDMYEQTAKARRLIRTLVYIAEKPTVAGIVEEAFNPTEVVQNVLGNLTLTSRNNGVAVILGKLPTTSVVGDEMAFRTVLTKTLCDFIDGSPSGSRVGIDSDLTRGSFDVRISSVVKSHEDTGALYLAMFHCDTLTSAMGANFAMHADHGEISAKISFPFKTPRKKLAYR